VTLGKEPFAECQKKTLGKETLCRVSKIKHSAKSFFAECFILPRVFCMALRKELLCRVPEIKHSAKNTALGKESNSGSDYRPRAEGPHKDSRPLERQTILLCKDEQDNKEVIYLTLWSHAG
jgi:hypothetical protein